MLMKNNNLYLLHVVLLYFNQWSSPWLSFFNLLIFFNIIILIVNLDYPFSTLLSFLNLDYSYTQTLQPSSWSIIKYVRQCCLCNTVYCHLLNWYVIHILSIFFCFLSTMVLRYSVYKDYIMGLLNFECKKIHQYWWMF